jgi:hypothetical protein
VEDRVQCFIIEEIEGTNRIFRRPGDDSQVGIPSSFGPGAMFRERLLEREFAGGHLKKAFRPFADGSIWTVILPDNRVWCVNQHSTERTFWEITGTVPNLTAKPSIKSPGYHGWLKEGWLIRDGS